MQDYAIDDGPGGNKNHPQDQTDHEGPDNPTQTLVEMAHFK